MSRSSGGEDKSDARAVYNDYNRGHTERENSSYLFNNHLSDIKASSKSQHSFKLTVPSFYSKDIISTSLETNESSYYTSSLEEGYANVEEVSENILQTNVPYGNEEKEIFIATRLESDYFSDQFNTNSQEFNFAYTKSDIVGTIISPDIFFPPNQSDSDSESEITFKLYSDTSSDDDFSSGISPFDIKEDRGNLPDFTKIDPVDKEKNVFKAPINPLVSKRTPTATLGYLSESSVDEPSHIISDTKSDSSLKDTEATIKKKQTSLASVKSDGRKTATFCSTNIQSALLSKITPDSKTSQGTTFNDFPKMQVQRRTALADLSSIEPTSKSEHERNIEVDLENFETEVGKAFEESVIGGSFMPLLKQELQCKIQVRRLSMGQSELVLEPEEPKVYELTEDEIKKRRARLEQNRRSAKKSRHKARKHEQKLLKLIKAEMTKQASLLKELKDLKSLRDKYKKVIELHMTSCSATVSPDNS